MPPHDETARLVEQVQAGDDEARDALLAHACRRLENRAHLMLGEFPVVQRYEQTNDILQEALLRLRKALGTVQLKSVKHFYRLATLQIRRELIDLARHYSGPEGEAANHHTDDHDPVNGILARQPGRDGEPASLAEWREIHETVEKLPEDEREIIDLLFYQGLTQKEAGDHLGVDERTVRRRLQEARCHLDELLQA